jgi:hypothetical protein
MFRDEDLAYALRLGQAGVPVEFHLHPGAPHESDFIAFNTTAARRHRRPRSFEHRMPSTGCGSPNPPARTSKPLGVERGHRTLVITRKGGKVVTIPLAPRTARAIDLAIGERVEGPIFPHLRRAAARPA